MAGDIPHIRSCILRRNLINEYPMVQIEYLELRRSGYEVYVGQYGTDGEVDFVAIKNGRVEYYRVAQTTLDDKVLCIRRWPAAVGAVLNGSGAAAAAAS